MRAAAQPQGHSPGRHGPAIGAPGRRPIAINASIDHCRFPSIGSLHGVESPYDFAAVECVARIRASGAKALGRDPASGTGSTTQPNTAADSIRPHRWPTPARAIVGCNRFRAQAASSKKVPGCGSLARTNRAPAPTRCYRARDLGALIGERGNDFVNMGRGKRVQLFIGAILDRMRHPYIRRVKS